VSASTVDCRVSPWIATYLPRLIAFDVEATQGRYHRFWPVAVGAQSFRFQFRARSAGDMYVAFLKSKTEQASSAYEVVIAGSNSSKSMIRYGTQTTPLVVASGLGIDLTKYKDYWVCVRANEESLRHTQAVSLCVFVVLDLYCV
jgi:hypothetical protein